MLFYVVFLSSKQLIFKLHRTKKQRQIVFLFCFLALFWNVPSFSCSLTVSGHNLEMNGAIVPERCHNAAPKKEAPARQRAETRLIQHSL